MIDVPEDVSLVEMPRIIVMSHMSFHKKKVITIK